MTNGKKYHLGHRARLRSRFLSDGGENIPDYELLEIILFAARARGDVKPLSKELLAKFGSLKSVFSASEQELAKIYGLGDAGIAAIKAASIAAKRMLLSEVKEKTILASWSALLDYARLTMGSLKIEEFHTIFLDNKNALIKDETHQKGTINRSQVYPREIVKRALELNAASIILLHNHPSGDSTPSEEDLNITDKIVEAAKAVNIKIHDHLIITENEHYSFRSYGLIK